MQHLPRTLNKEFFLFLILIPLDITIMFIYVAAVGNYSTVISFQALLKEIMAGLLVTKRCRRDPWKS